MTKQTTIVVTGALRVKLPKGSSKQCIAKQWYHYLTVKDQVCYRNWVSGKFQILISELYRVSKLFFFLSVQEQLLM